LRKELKEPEIVMKEREVKRDDFGEEKGEVKFSIFLSKCNWWILREAYILKIKMIFMLK